MVNQRSIGIRTLTLFWQLVLVTLSYWGWMLIWQSALFTQHDILQRYLLYNEFLLIGMLFGSSGKREVNGLEHNWVLAIRKSMRQALLGLFCVFLIIFILQDTTENLRSFLFSYIPWLYVTLLFSNYLLPRVLGKRAFSGDREERVALAGTVEQATKIKPWLERKSLVGLRTIGLVCPPPSSTGVSPFPVLGSVENMGQILRDWSITQVIVLDLSIGSSWVQQLTQLCEGAAVRLLALHDPSDYFNHTTTTFEDDGVRFVGLREEPLESPVYQTAHGFGGGPADGLVGFALHNPVGLDHSPFSVTRAGLFQTGTDRHAGPPLRDVEISNHAPEPQQRIQAGLEKRSAHLFGGKVVEETQHRRTAAIHQCASRRYECGRAEASFA